MKRLKLLFILIAVVFLTSACESVGLGSDGSGPVVSPVSSGINVEPYCNTNYDFYLGEVALFGTGADILNPPITSGSTDLLPNIESAQNNFNNGHGVGAGAYVFLGGPGANPNMSPTAWGAEQANWAWAAHNNAEQTMQGVEFNFNFVMADVESTGLWLAPTSQANITANQDVWLGFVNTFQGEGHNVMLYSAGNFWASYFGNLPVTTVEDTSEQDYGPITPCPTADNNSSGPGGYNAGYFDTTSAINQLVWQWSENPPNGVGDFDFVNMSNYNALFNINDSP